MKGLTTLQHYQYIYGCSDKKSLVKSVQQEYNITLPLYNVFIRFIQKGKINK